MLAPDGVATLGEVFRRVDALGIELVDISLRKPLARRGVSAPDRTDRRPIMKALVALTERSLISADVLRPEYWPEQVRVPAGVLLDDRRGVDRAGIGVKLLGG